MLAAPYQAEEDAMVNTLSCPNCAALLPTPEGSYLVRCEFCGATCDLRTTEQPPTPAARSGPAPGSVEALHAQIQRDPLDVAPYRELRKIYMQRPEYDPAWCLCAALSFLQKANAEEEQLYQRFRPQGLVRASARATDELWSRYLFHPDQDRYLSAIFAKIAPALREVTAQRHKAFGLKPKQRRDLTTDQASFSKLLSYGVSALNLPTPELYVSDKHPGLMTANTEGAPSFVVARDLLEGPQEQLAFTVGKQLCYLRPEHFAKRMLPATEQLAAAFWAAVGLIDPQAAVPFTGAELAKFRKLLSRELSPALREGAARHWRRLVESGANVRIDRWWSATELTANRVGFILCNDVGLAARMINAEPPEAGELSANEQIKDLLAYSVSLEYFEVRKQLGLTLN